MSGNLISSGAGSAFGRTAGVVLTTDYSVTRYGYLTDQAAAYY